MKEPKTDVKTIEELIQLAKTNRKGIRRLKEAAVTLQAYGLAQKIRQAETETFPETEEEKTAEKINILFRMVDIRSNPKSCWILYEVIKSYLQVGGDFSTKEAVSIMSKADEIFGKE